jgi:hypothetical protein
MYMASLFVFFSFWEIEAAVNQECAATRQSVARCSISRFKIGSLLIKYLSPFLLNADIFCDQIIKIRQLSRLTG